MVPFTSRYIPCLLIIRSVSSRTDLLIIKYAVWDWGTFQGHVGQKMKSQRSRNGELPKLVLPACGPLTFVARQEEEPWPDRASYLAHPAMSFESANIEESMWWTEEAFRRAIERAVSPPPITASERVYVHPLLILLNVRRYTKTIAVRVLL